MSDPATRLLFLPVALCDFTASVLEGGAPTPSGKGEPRLRTQQGPRLLEVTPAPKIIASVRRERKDIFLVGFKTTAGASPSEQLAAGLTLLKTASCNLVLANDLHTRVNRIVTPASGIDAIEVVMALRPSALEGRRLRFARRAWAVHNLVGHPLMQALSWLGHRELGLWLHDATVPRPRAPFGHASPCRAGRG